MHLIGSTPRSICYVLFANFVAWNTRSSTAGLHSIRLESWTHCGRKEWLAVVQHWLLCVYSLTYLIMLNQVLCLTFRTTKSSYSTMR